MVCLLAEHDRSSGKNKCTHNGRERNALSARLGSARQTSAGYRIAGYKLLSDRDLSSIRANDALALAVTREKGSPPLLAPYSYIEHLVAFFCSCLNRVALRRFRGRASTDSNFKGWIGLGAESERITIPSGKPSISVRMNVDLGFTFYYREGQVSLFCF